MEEEKKLYEILCNTSNKNYFYTYLDKYEVKNLEDSLKIIIDMQKDVLEGNKYNFDIN